MADDTIPGDHDYVDPRDPNEFQPGLPPKSVYDAECRAIAKRRDFIRRCGGRDRTGAGLTGLALSGGGVRSASFGLGCLQALHATFKDSKQGKIDKIIHGIEEIDYISTVSGGGYIGCCLTAAMQSTGPDCRTAGRFPFTNPDDPGDYSDTDAVRHIRDFSNYLIPHGALDVATAIGIIGRGLVANWLIILPVLLLAVSITLLLHPTVASLGKPSFLIKPLIDLLPLLPSWRGYWLTGILLLLNLVFLIAWACSTSWGLGSSGKLKGGWVFGSKILFIATLVTAFFETQPFILWVINSSADAVDSGNLVHKQLHDFWERISSSLAAIGTLFGSMGTIFAFLSKYLRDAVAAAERSTGWQAWLKKGAATAALWLAGLLVPILLWLIYLWLVNSGLGRDGEGGGKLYFILFLISALVALSLNPNRTSLYGLYKDRLSKAFLFDPDGARRDEYGDLRSFDPKLHKIDTNLCPYPIVNAALNIEGSQYGNKRGRNADFFIFTPEYTGSDATGYVGTKRIKKDPKTLLPGMDAQRTSQEKMDARRTSQEKKEEGTALDLGTAMTISAAAVSSNMGSLTIKPLAFTLAFFNLRLGYWLENPRLRRNEQPKMRPRDWLKAQLFRLHSIVLFSEMFSLIDENSPKIYLTDGGHIENLGVYSLLERRCKVIIAVDAEADPEMSFHSFLKLERYARIDLGVIIDLPWQSIRDQSLELDKAADKAKKGYFAIPALPGPHCAACEIRYGPDNKENGILLYVKASLSGDEADYLLDYKRRYRAFPHETTGDQFFSEEQLEVYRALGFHIMRGLLTREAPFAVKPRPGETEDAARGRILAAVSQALQGTAVFAGRRR